MPNTITTSGLVNDVTTSYVSSIEEWAATHADAVMDLGDVDGDAITTSWPIEGGATKESETTRQSGGGASEVDEVFKRRAMFNALATMIGCPPVRGS